MQAGPYGKHKRKIGKTPPAIYLPLDSLVLILYSYPNVDDSYNNSLQEKIFGFLKKNILISVLFFGGLIFLCGGLIQYFLHINTNASGVEFVSGQDVKSASTSAEKVFVDVSGEVQNPGVYELDSSARVQDAFLAAGGLGPDADRDYIAKSVNLASPLKDGMKIYVPKVGEAPASSGTANTSGSTVNSSGLVSINSASQSDLEALPGIGPVTAGKIIAGRPYSSTEELLTKKAVGKSVYDKIKDQISL